MPLKNWESLLRPFDGGTTASNQIEPMETTGGTRSPLIPLRDLLNPPNRTAPMSLQQKDGKLHSAGSVLGNKRMISNDKKNPSQKRTRITKSSPTSGQVSISKGKDSYGWWNPLCKEMSKRLSSPTAIDSVGLRSNLSNGFATREIPTSWSRTKRYVPQTQNSQKISWPSSMFSPADTTGCDATEKDPDEEVKDKLCQKIRLKPTAQQARILRKWMTSARKTYNLGLRMIKDKKAKPNLKLKKLIVTARVNDNANIKLMKETPADIRVRAVKDLIASFKTATAGYRARKKREAVQKKRWKKSKKSKKNNNGRRRRWKKRPIYTVKYKSKRLISDSFGFEKKSIKSEGKHIFLFSTVKKFEMGAPIRMSEELKHPINSDCRISVTHGRWYLLSPYDSDVMKETTSTPVIVALDPGVRTFSAYFTSDGEMGEIGNNMDVVYKKINKKITGIQQRMKETSGKRANRLRRAWYRAHARSSFLVDDFHWKTIKFLLDKFDVVIAPHLNVSQMVSKESVLDKSTKAVMLFQRHYQFRLRLKMKANTRGKVVHDLEEHGTSATCSQCGNNKTDLGSSKVYNCTNCGMHADRDLNSAKNHILKSAFGNAVY